MFYPEKQQLTLYHHTGKKYVAVKAKAQARYFLPRRGLVCMGIDSVARGKPVPQGASRKRTLDSRAPVCFVGG